MILVRSLVAIFALAMLVACSTSRGPKLEVLGVRTSEVTDEHARLVIDVRATNSGSDPLPLKSVVYSIDLDGRPAFSAVRDSQATVARFSTQRIVLPAIVAADLVTPGRTRYRVRGTLEYVAPEVLAQTLFDYNIKSWTSELQGEGVVENGGSGSSVTSRTSGDQ